MTYEGQRKNHKNISLPIIIVLLILPLSQLHMTSINKGVSENLSEVDLSPNISKLTLSYPNLQYYQSNLIFQHDNKNFYLTFGSFSFYFLNSSILIKNQDIATGKFFSITYSFNNANNILPQGIRSSNTFASNGNNDFGISELLYQNIYQKIDLVFFSTHVGLKYNFIIHPGGNPNEISFKITTNLLIKNNLNSLNFYSSNESKIALFSDSNLFSYQSAQQNVNSSFIEKSTKSCSEICYGFNVGSYDTTKNLIIDPYWVEFDKNITLSNLGTNIMQANGMQFDNEGNILVYGQIEIKNETNLFIVKYLPDGSIVNYKVFGGSGNDSVDINNNGKAIQIDNNDNIYLTGYTNSIDLPNAKNNYSGSLDAFLIKLSKNLDIVNSYYLGGSKDDKGKSIAIYDNTIFVSGITSSTNFTVKSAIEKTFNGGNIDGFIAKFDLNCDLIFSTYFGGNRDDNIISTNVDHQGNLIVTGSTTSSSFNITQNAIQPIIASSDAPDAFIAKISNDGSSIIFNTYFGGDGTDQGNGIAIDSSNNIYVIGTSTSQSISATQSIDTNSVPFYTGLLGSSRIFVAEIDELGYRLPNYYQFSGGGNDTGLSIILDNNNEIVITGYSYSSNFWNKISIQSNEHYANTRAFITRVNKTSSTMDMSSIVQKNCLTTTNYCLITGQDLLVDKNNNIFLLGNNQLVEENTSKFSWIPYLDKISSKNDITPPFISIAQYSVSSQYSIGENLTIQISDDLSGVNYVTFHWNNDTPTILTYPFIITIPNIPGNSILYITAVDLAGNSNPQQYTIILKGSDIQNEVFLVGSIALSIVTGYLAINLFWKYYFSKKKIKGSNLERQDVNSYLDFVKKDETIIDELTFKDKKK